MTLKEYLKKLNKLVKDQPDVLNMEAIASVDEEGNEFKPVYFDPSVVDGAVCLN